MGAAGIASDAQDRLWLVSSASGRIQQYTKNGVYMGGFDGSDPERGGLNRPAGIAVDGEGFLYVADWGNHRVRKYDTEGRLLLTFGDGPAGRLRYPTSVAVDNEGDVYVADAMQDRVVIYNASAQPLAYLHGDATDLSFWAELSLAANPDFVSARRRVPDLLQQQRTFRMPMACTFDRPRNLLFVCDTARDRVQIYRKDMAYVDAPFNL